MASLGITPCAGPMFSGLPCHPHCDVEPAASQVLLCEGHSEPSRRVGACGWTGSSPGWWGALGLVPWQQWWWWCWMRAPGMVGVADLSCRSLMPGASEWSHGRCSGRDYRLSAIGQPLWELDSWVRNKKAAVLSVEWETHVCPGSIDPGCERGLPLQCQLCKCRLF